MPSVFDQRVHLELRERLQRLRPEAPAQWGGFDAPTMLAHVDAALVATLEGGMQARSSAMARWPLNKLLIHVLPWPKGKAESPEEFLVPPASDWERALGATLNHLEAIALRGADWRWPVHPTFGNLAGRDWGVLTWKHVDHHLRQFGV